MLGLRFCARAFSSCGKRGPLFIAVCGPLTIAASLVAEHRLQTHRLSSCGSRASCSAACGIFPDQGSNPCPLHWQADSQPLRHQGSPQAHSWHQFCHPLNGDSKSRNLTEILWGLNEMVYIRCLAQCEEYSKCSNRISYDYVAVFLGHNRNFLLLI